MKAVLSEIKLADDKKSVENSVKSYAFVFYYYVNAFLAGGLSAQPITFCAFATSLTSPTTYQSKFIVWLRVKVYLPIL